MNVPIELIAVTLGAMLSAIIALQGWMLARIVSLEKKVAVVMAQCKHCQTSDTEHLVKI
jgi:hypothetical protein